MQLPVPVDAFGVEHRVAARETAEAPGFERTELRDAQRLDPDLLGARTRQWDDHERQQRE